MSTILYLYLPVSWARKTYQASTLGSTTAYQENKWKIGQLHVCFSQEAGGSGDRPCAPTKTQPEQRGSASIPANQPSWPSVTPTSEAAAMERRVPEESTMEARDVEQHATKEQTVKARAAERRDTRSSDPWRRTLLSDVSWALAGGHWSSGSIWRSGRKGERDVRRGERKRSR